MSTIIADTPLTPDDLTFVADALLTLCEPRTRWHLREDRRITSLDYEPRDLPIYQALNHGRVNDPMLRMECDEICQLARLTPTQTRVLGLRLNGFSFEEIATIRRHSKQGAQSIFLQALKKLTRALHVYPYRGLADVYRNETRRGG